MNKIKASDSVKLNKIPNPTKHFSHLFSFYAKYINAKYQRHGNLFERAFKRKKIYDENYFRDLVLYIHNNPVHYGFYEHPVEWDWGCYQSCLSLKQTKLKRNEVIGWFNDKASFKYMHEQKIDIIKTEKWLEVK